MSSIPQSFALPHRVVSAASADEHAAGDRIWTAIAGAFVVTPLWFGMIARSFWIDEAGTWWIVKDSAAEAVHRALSWSGQSPLYYLIAWLSSRLFGMNEIALRIPSVLALSGAAYFLFRIAERLIDRATATMAAFVFLCSASFYATQARPYALALLCLTASTWRLIRWIETNRVPDAILYVLTAALVVYAHVLLSVGLAAGIVYAVAVFRSTSRRVVWLAVLQAAIVLLCIPLFGELRTFYSSRAAHIVAPAPVAADLLTGLIPCSLIGALVMLAWSYMNLRTRTGVAWKCPGATALLIGIWSVFPPLLFFLLAVSTDLQLYLPRYFSSALPGEALFVGALLASVQSRNVRRALIAAVAATAILSSGFLTGGSYGSENWRDAMAFVRKEAGSAPVLMVSGFVEASGFSILRNPELREILFAPSLRYGEPEHTIHLPNALDERSEEMRKLAAQLRDEPRFFLVTQTDHNYELWLLGALDRRCKTESTGNQFGHLGVTRFTCER